MKHVMINDMRKIEGGVTYVTFCGATFTDNSPWKLLKGLVHINFCSACRGAKKVYGVWYTFNNRNARRRVWGF